jgi:glycine dehydrogenase subunit 1
MVYLPHGPDERQQMLETIGVGSTAELFSSIPARLLRPRIDLPPPLSEQELVAEVEALAARNRPLGPASFLGAGVYRRFIPAVVRAAISRPEFYTAYTPYQAEASQGTLQSIFEFQSMICALTGLPVANASMYDGATAAAEAAMIAMAATGRRHVLLSRDLHPETVSVIRTYARGRHLEVVLADDPATEVGPDDAGVIVPQPGFLGTVSDLAEVAEAAHAAGALAIAAVDPLACCLLTPPGGTGCDIAVGDGQPLGISPSFGGPHVGFMAVRQELMRRIPGRLVGLTSDATGRRAYTLTLQAREQHIRREKAVSNICTNHALMALAATVYMAWMGAEGMRRVAEISVQRAHHLADRLASLDGFSLADPERPFLWEFVLRVPGGGEDFVARMKAEGIIAGLPLSRLCAARHDQVLVCCTEMTPPAAIDGYIAAASRPAAPVALSMATARA